MQWRINADAECAEELIICAGQAIDAVLDNTSLTIIGVDVTAAYLREIVCFQPSSLRHLPSTIATDKTKHLYPN
jgi:hypothetical protein